jgi:hypothetical protein
MTTSGTYSFSPVNSDLLTLAFRRAGVKRNDLDQEHIADGIAEMRMQGVDWANRNPNRWLIDTQSILLVAGTAAYTVNARIVETAIVYYNDGQRDRVIGPLSASEYGAIANKTTQGPPTTFWISMAVTPSITLWPVPDSAYTLYIQSFRQMQDMNAANGETPDMPYRFYDAFVTGLAGRLAEIYNPAKADRLNAQHEAKFKLAAAMDQEQVPLSLIPGLDQYTR